MKKAERLPFRVTQKLTPWLPGIPEVLEFPWSTEGDDVDLCEHVRETGALYSDSLGNAWGAAIPSQHGRYNPVPAQQQRQWEVKQRERQIARERLADREWVAAEAKRQRQQHEWERQVAAHARKRQLVQDLAELRKRDQAEQRECAEAEHRRREALWRAETERHLKLVTDWVLAGWLGKQPMDAELVWLILRYQNLGPGMVGNWSPAAFMAAVEHIWRGNGKQRWSYEDIERCHRGIVAVWGGTEFQRKLNNLRA